MKCSKARESYSAYMEGAIGPKTHEAFELHLAECAGCKADYEKFKAAVAVLDELPEVQVPSGFHAAVMARVEQARRATPRPVKWWHLDWQRVFVVRVPAKAVALGFAVLMMMALVIQLTPVSTITAGWLWPHKTARQVGINDESTVHLSNEGCNLTADKGLSIRVSPKGSKYDLLLKTNSPRMVGFTIDAMSETLSDAAGGASSEGRIYSGSVSRDRDAAVSRLENLRAVKVTWRSGGCVGTQVVFLPSRFNPRASGKSISLSFTKTNLYNALSSIAESYGIVVLASGNLSKEVRLAGVSPGRPEEALYNVAMRTGMRWHAVGSSVYTVEPAR